jgi:hypothetical protein
MQLSRYRSDAANPEKPKLRTWREEMLPHRNNKVYSGIKHIFDSVVARLGTWHSKLRERLFAEKTAEYGPILRARDEERRTITRDASRADTSVPHAEYAFLFPA